MYKCTQLGTYLGPLVWYGCELMTDINNSRHSQNTHQNNYLRCSKPRMPHCNHYCSPSFAFSHGFFSSLQFLFYFPFLVKNKCKKVNLAIIVLIFQTSNEMRNKLWLLMNYKSCNLFTVVSLVNKNAIKTDILVTVV